MSSNRFKDVPLKSEREQTFSITDLTGEEMTAVLDCLRNELNVDDFSVSSDLIKSIIQKMGEDPDE